METHDLTVSYDEQGRMAAVRRYNVLDTPPDGHFDTMTRLAARMFQVPVAIVSIVDDERVWFKSRYGVEVAEVPRAPGLCASAILQDDIYLLNDTMLDPHALSNPLVAGDFGLRFYAAAPLTISDGFKLGTFCILDFEPRDFSKDDLLMLEHFASMVVGELKLRLDARQIMDRERQFNEQLQREVESRTEQLRKAQNQLIENERLAAVGEFASSIVHDIRTPLTTIRMGIEAACPLVQGEGVVRRLRLAMGETDRLQNLLSEILLYAKPQRLEFAQVDLKVLTEEAVAAVSDDLGLATERFVQHVGGDCVVEGDRGKLKQMLINLITNACEAGGAEPVRISARLHAEDSMVVIDVGNHGRAIPVSQLDKILEPFFTTKVGGTGLGLAIVQRIVDAHQGELKITSSEEQGTVVQAKLPTDQTTNRQTVAH